MEKALEDSFMKSLPMVFLISAWLISASAVADCSSYPVAQRDMQEMNEDQLVECICDAERALQERQLAYTTRDGGVYLYDPSPLELLRENIAQAKNELTRHYSNSAGVNCTFIQ